MKTLILSLLTTGLMLISLTSVGAQVIECPQDTAVSIDDYKFIQSWAEYGLACEKAVLLLQNQITKDLERTVEMETKLNNERHKNKRLKIIVKTLVVVAILETTVILFLIIP